MNRRNHFTKEDIAAFAPAEKVGIVATINDDNIPHLSLLTSIMAHGENTVTIGEFCRGVSKTYMQKKNNISFALLTMDKRLWRGRARWTELKQEGPEYEIYNQQPMFRYNTYFGINTVHYLDLLEIEGPESLPIWKIITSAIKTKLAKGGASTAPEEQVMKDFAVNLFNKLDSLKFLSWMGDEGFPVIIPIIQCQASDTGRLFFHPGPYGEELNRIADGSEVTVFGLTMQMEDVLVRGTYRAPKRYRGIRGAAVDISWVYNSMPPNHGQIYPKVPLETVTEF